MPIEEPFVFSENLEDEMRQYYDVELRVPDVVMGIVLNKSMCNTRMRSLGKLGTYVYRHARLGEKENTRFAHRLCAINIKSTMELIRTQGYYQTEEADIICCELTKVKRGLFVIATLVDNLDEMYDVFSQAMVQISLFGQ